MACRPTGATPILAAAVLLIAGAGPAAAQFDYPDWCDAYGALDRNGDGVLDDEEIAAFRQAAFPEWDRDDDAGLIFTEFEACYRRTDWYGGGTQGPAVHPYAIRHTFTLWDLNGDGRLSQEEFMPVTDLRRLDADGDGEVHAVEVAEALRDEGIDIDVTDEALIDPDEIGLGEEAVEDDEEFCAEPGMTDCIGRVNPDHD